MQQTDQDILKVTEIYSSVQGESSYAGLPCVFIRLSGCPLRCRWCDTVYSFKDGKSKSIDQIVMETVATKIPLVELTGGEPLAQKPAFSLVTRLADAGLKVLIETGGSEPIKDLDKRAHVIMDIKCPGSGMHEKNMLANVEFLKPTDEVKFVVANCEDFDWTRSVISELQLDKKCKVLISPAWGLVKPDELVSWILSSSLNVRLNLQIHKYIWGPRAKGV